MSKNKLNDVVEIRIVTKQAVYEVISVYRLQTYNDEQGNKVEVSLRGKKVWEIQF